MSGAAGWRGRRRAGARPDSPALRTRPVVAAAVLVVVVAAAACAPAGEPTGGSSATGRALGMVSSAHPIATRAGLEILEAGGNAFDAAVAVAATLDVVEPMMSGMGGYGTILVHHAGSGATRFLNASDRIPRGVDPDLFREPTPGYQENRRGAKAVSTPGNVRAWEALAEEYGTLPWARLFEPAIQAAEEGFELDATTAFFVADAFAGFPDHARRIYGRDGEPLEEGDTLVQADLARSLRRVAEEGASGFYAGPVADAIVAAMEVSGGFLARQDLEESQAEWWEPIAIDYRGHRVATASPPATAFPALVRLGMMSRLDVDALGHNSVEYLHRFAEVTKHAFWTRLAWAGDPELRPPPLDTLLSAAYWQEQVDAIDPGRARPFEYPDVVVAARGAAAEPGLRAAPPVAVAGEAAELAAAGGMAGRAPGAPGPSVAGGLAMALAHTTHFVVVDGDGSIVSATQTPGNSFGARIMPEGTGIWLNNSLAYCTFEPAGNPMDAHPGRRKLSGDVPTIVFREGLPWVALGTPGGHTIGQTVPQMVMNLVDFEMGLQEAIDAPRVAFVEPDVLAVERLIAEEVRAALGDLGHQVRSVDALGNAHAVMIERGPDGRPVAFTGAADRRGSGLARGR